MHNNIIPKFYVKNGAHDYAASLIAMRNFTEQRNKQSHDQIWFLEHNPTFTLGANSNPIHILNNTEIPIVQSDRGGQVTYHGPGQLMCYMMINLNRLPYSVHDLVERLEQTIVQLLKTNNIKAHTLKNMRGVYVNNKKIASIGLRFKKFCSYHGFALNVDMDMQPFKTINPCGYPKLEMTQMIDLNPNASITKVIQQLQPLLLKYLYPALKENIHDISQH